MPFSEDTQTRLGDVHSPGLYGEPLVFQPGSTIGQTRIHHYDGTGSLSEMTDLTGAVTDVHRYRAFGDVLHDQYSMGGASCYEAYGGQLEYWRHNNSAGIGSLDYVRARYYAYGSGRFISRDPIIFNPGNPYQYALNSPLNLIDPSGMWSRCQAVALPDPSVPSGWTIPTTDPAYPTACADMLYRVLPLYASRVRAAGATAAAIDPFGMPTACDDLAAMVQGVAGMNCVPNWKPNTWGPWEDYRYNCGCSSCGGQGNGGNGGDGGGDWFGGGNGTDTCVDGVCTHSVSTRVPGRGGGMGFYHIGPVIPPGIVKPQPVAAGQCGPTGTGLAMAITPHNCWWPCIPLGLLPATVPGFDVCVAFMCGGLPEAKKCGRQLDRRLQAAAALRAKWQARCDAIGAADCDCTCNQFEGWPEWSPGHQACLILCGNVKAYLQNLCQEACDAEYFLAVMLAEVDYIGCLMNLG
jgi:RHS repeat-associated protein